MGVIVAMLDVVDIAIATLDVISTMNITIAVLDVVGAMDMGVHVVVVGITTNRIYLKYFPSKNPLNSN